MPDPSAVERAAAAIEAQFAKGWLRDPVTPPPAEAMYYAQLALDAAGYATLTDEVAGLRQAAEYEAEKKREYQSEANRLRLQLAEAQAALDAMVDHDY